MSHLLRAGDSGISLVFLKGGSCTAHAQVSLASL